MTIVTTYRGFDIHKIEAREFSEILGSRNRNRFPIYVPYNGPFNASTMQKTLGGVKKFIDLRYKEINVGKWGKDGEILKADSSKFVPKPEFEPNTVAVDNISPARESLASRRKQRIPRNLRARERSKTDYWADKKYIETYRSVEIYRHQNKSYMAKDEGMSAGDVETLRYMIDSKLDTGNAEDEIQKGQSTIYTKSRGRARTHLGRSRERRRRGQPR